jgi:pimeloyl-ACP methyl ester carboxylesterase
MLNHKTYGSGPDLVILHGLFGMLDNWSTLARRWAENYTVTLVDLRNHGRSFHSDEMNYALMAEDIATLLEEQGIDECFLMGHSMGGKVAMQTALSYPDLVQKLIVVDITPRKYRRGHDDVFAALEAFNPAEVSDRKEAARLMNEYMPNPGVQLFLLKNLARKPEGGFKWRMNLPAIKASYEKLSGPVGNFGDVYDSPTLFIRGGKSGYVQDDDIELIKMLFPQTRLETVEGAGHWVHAERPEALFEVVNNFIGE